MHSLKRILSTIVGSTATIKSSGTSSSSSRLTDIPNSQQYQYHHYHHQKVNIIEMNFEIVMYQMNQDFIIFFFCSCIFPAYSIVFHNNAIKFESGASFALFGCVFIYIIHLDALW